MHDYEKAKEIYINAGWHSGVSLKTVAERCNIPYQSLRRKAAKERWRLEREMIEVDDPECQTVDDYVYYYK
ncbi:hypothetical protein [Piscibacillus halophilus]|uniref:hypothetical protein n=1 Tax=Piscibacillus halophilus TaxID=571933 RepID=UPI00158AA660|nr:hypothetical protein [Piscibacillus halophilus]